MSLTATMAGLLRVLRSEVPDYVASGVVDLSSGMLLAVDTVDPQPPEVLDVLADATADLFRGRRMVQIERMWRHRRADPGAVPPSEEVLMRNGHLLHLFIRSQADDLVVAVVCRSTANLGLLLSVSRQAVRDLLPG